MFLLTVMSLDIESKFRVIIYKSEVSPFVSSFPLAVLPACDGSKGGFSLIWKILLSSFLVLAGVWQCWCDEETILMRIWDGALEAPSRPGGGVG